MKSRIKILLLVVFCVCSLFIHIAHANPMGMEPQWLGTPFMEGWVPEGDGPVRGVLVLDGWPFDDRWYEAATYWQFAILRVNSDKYGEDLPQEDETFAILRQHPHKLKSSAVAEGLARLAERTGHEEIKWVPIVSSGFSRYSGPARGYQEAFPDRALGLINGHGGSPKGDDPIWKVTPSIGLQCEWENIFSGGDKTRLLNDWWRRPEGSLSTMGIFWRVYHKPDTFPDLGIVFIDETIKARIPQDWDPKEGPCKLKPLKEEEGWLGSHEGWRVPVEKIFVTDNENAEIKPFKEFEGDKQRTSWLISKNMAWAWRAFSSRYPKAILTQPGKANIVLHEDQVRDWEGHLEAGVRAGEPFTIEARSYVADMKEIEFYAYDTKLGTATAENASGGEMALGNTNDALFATKVQIDKPGIYALMGKYRTTEDEVGWTRPLTIVVWGEEE